MCLNFNENRGFFLNSWTAKMEYQRRKYAKQNLLSTCFSFMGRCHGPFITLSCHTNTHTRSYARTCSVFIVVVFVVVALTFMLIANGVTNIIHWIKIRNSILSWEFQSWNCTKQFHDYSLKTQDWDCCFFASIALCVVKLGRARKKLIAKNANLPVWVCDFCWLFFAFLLMIRANRILSIQRSKWFC